MRNNKKIIALVCALSMIFTMLASFTIVRADEAAAGIKLEVVQAQDESGKTEATVTATYDSSFESIGGAKVKFSIPSGATVTPVSEPFKAIEGVLITINDKVDGQYIYSIAPTDPASTDGNVLAVLKVSFPNGLSKSETIELINGAEIMNADGSVYLTIEDGSMAASSGTLKQDPTAEEKEPIAKDTDYDKEKVEVPTVTVKPEVEPTTVGGIAFSDPVKVDGEDAYTFTATYTGIETTGGAKVKFSIPSGATVTPVSEPFKAIEGVLITINDKVDGQYIYSIAPTDPASTDGKVLATFKVTYPEGGLAEDFNVELIDGAEIMDADGTIYNTVADKSLAGVWITLPASVEDDRNEVALDDKVTSDDIAAVADAEDAYLAVEVTKDDGSTPVYGEDYTAYYNGAEINEDTLKALLAGDVEGYTLADAAKGLTFKYNNGVNLKFQLVADGEVAKEAETEGGGDEPGPSPAPSSAKQPTLTVTPATKSISTGDKQTITFTYDEKDFTTDAAITITTTEATFDTVTGTGIKLAYTDAEGKAVSTKITEVETVLDNIAASGKITIDFTAAVKGTAKFTAAYAGKDEDGNANNKLEKTATITIKTSSDGGSTKSSSSSSDSKSSGGGAIATGLVDLDGGSGVIGVGFPDLGEAEWARTPVTALAARNIISGYEDGTFRPNGNITRAEYAQILINAINHNGDSADTTFDDVPTDAWYYHNVAVAAQLGIVSGYGDGNFGPFDLITREQMALMTEKAAEVVGVNLDGAEVGQFSDDAEISDWASDAVYTLANAGIINGMGDGTFAPKANATRAQAATIIYNAFIN